MHSQIKVSHKIEIIDAQGQEYIDVKLIYENDNSKKYSIWINTWRIIFVTNENQQIFGFPYISNLVNFLFITPEIYNFDNYLNSQAEFHDVGDIYTNRIKILEPKEKFIIHILIRDKRVITFLKNNKYKISYMYGVCPYKNISSIISVDEKNFYQSSDLLLANIPILENKLGYNSRATFFYFMNDKKMKISTINFNNLFEKRFYNFKISNCSFRNTLLKMY
ncbi:hypothetical protein E0494_02500 [Marinilabiliaceae bacterium JC040]|nr:hypothetical protein [Marinilabiliaceae bacterium JC040]